MLAFPLAVLLAAAPPPVETWSARACPPSKEAPGSNVEMKFREQQRAECLRKAMDKAVERAATPVKKTRPAAGPDWLALQADYLRWMQDACATLEEASWVDLTSGERSMGTGYGFIESQCLQRHQAWRGYWAEACGRGECPAPAQVFPALEGTAREARTGWRAYATRVRRAAERAPERAADPEQSARTLSRADWQTYTERLERMLAGPEALAVRQCALLPGPAPTDCAPRFADGLLLLLESPPPATP